MDKITVYLLAFIAAELLLIWLYLAAIRFRIKETNHLLTMLYKMV